jgi:hypothetical protein
MGSQTLTVVSNSHLLNRQLWIGLSTLVKKVNYPPRILKIITNTMDRIWSKDGKVSVAVYSISSQDNTEVPAGSGDSEHAGLISYLHPDTDETVWAPSAMGAQTLNRNTVVWNCDHLDPVLLEGDYDAAIFLEAAMRIVHEVNHAVNGPMPYDPEATYTFAHLRHELRAWTVGNALEYWLGSKKADKATDPDTVERKAFTPMSRYEALANDIFPQYPPLQDLYDDDADIRAKTRALCNKSTSWDGLCYTSPGETITVTEFPGVLDNR